MITLPDLFEQRANAAPERVAVHHKGIDTRYGQLAHQAETVAAWLSSQGVHSGDRVALILPNSVEYVAAYMGILRLGAVVVALNPDIMADEVQYTLNDSTPTAVVVGSKAAKPVAEAASQLSSIRSVVLVGDCQVSFPASWHSATWQDVIATDGLPPSGRPQLDDIAQIIYTSGTTGRPKGVTLTHRNIAANCRSILSYLKLSGSDSVFVTLPFFYSYGNSLLFTHLAIGGRMVLAGDFVFWNRALDLMQQQRVTGFSGVPSTFAMLLHKSDFRRRDFKDLRYMTCAGGGLAPASVERIQDIVPEVSLFLMYGQTEATARLSTLLPDEIDAKLGSIGRGIPDVELEVQDEAGQLVPVGEVGEIVARGENVMIGYWNDSEQTREVLGPAGLRTGDLARVDNDGYIFIVGRRKDIIKSGAYRINPQEIEEVILKLEGIVEVAVAGVPHEIWGESPVAFVVPAPNCQPPSAEDIIEHCRQFLPRYKLIHGVELVSSLPKTSSGKIKRGELKRGASSIPS